jgi:acyl-coenzyme A thioesterase PaaI-like protein
LHLHDKGNGKPGNTNAGIQGGFGAAFVDCVGSILFIVCYSLFIYYTIQVCANAIVFITKFGKTVATLEQKCTFLKPIPVDTVLYAEAQILKLGKQVAMLEATLRTKDANGEILLRASQTNQLLELPQPAPKSKL